MEVDGTGAQKSAKKAIPMSRVRPNFFVAVQVSNPVIHQAVCAVQNLVVSKKPVYKSILIKLITLHITLCTLHLPGNDGIKRAKLALNKLEEFMKESLVQGPINLKFKGIGSYNNEVVFAKVEPGEPLTQLTDMHVCLTTALRDEGFIVSNKFTPHLTIMKMSRNQSLRKKRIFKIPKNLYGDECDMVFGDQTLRSVQLLEMENHAEDSYYNCYHSIDLGTCDAEMEDHLICCGVQSVIPTTIVELPPEEEEVVHERSINLDTADEVIHKKGRFGEGLSKNDESGTVKEKVSSKASEFKREATELGTSEVQGKLGDSEDCNVEGGELKAIEKRPGQNVGETVKLPVMANVGNLVFQKESATGETLDDEGKLKTPGPDQDGSTHG